MSAHGAIGSEWPGFVPFSGASSHSYATVSHGKTPNRAAVLGARSERYSSLGREPD